jgi:CBS domain-containing protein
LEQKVLNYMKRGAITCSESTSIREVAQIMVLNRTRYCAVLNDDHELTGIVSAQSILWAFGNDLEKTSVRDILLPYTVTITPGHSLSDAINVMKAKKIEHLVVVSERPGSKAVVGILNAGDIVTRLAHDTGGQGNG